MDDEERKALQTALENIVGELQALAAQNMALKIAVQTLITLHPSAETVKAALARWSEQAAETALFHPIPEKRIDDLRDTIRWLCSSSPTK